MFQEVEAGHADFGVVPVENSGQGTIQSTLDMFLTSPLKICGEVELHVHQYLLSRTGRIEDIERVYSHPHVAGAVQGLVAAEPARRPRSWRWRATPKPRGARALADDAAAIAGESAGHVYGLKKVVAGPIEDRQDNTTRFLVLGRELFTRPGHDRTSLLVFVRDQPGALYNVLSPFARHGISMNRIESRPSHSGLWQYAFFIDVAGHVDDEPVQDGAVRAGRVRAPTCKMLGSYPVALL